MADFLTRLASRALEQAPVVRPRTPSLFEPPAGGMENASPSELEATATIPTPTQIHESQASPAAPRQSEVLQRKEAGSSPATIAANAIPTRQRVAAQPAKAPPQASEVASPPKPTAAQTAPSLTEASLPAPPAPPIESTRAVLSGPPATRTDLSAVRPLVSSPPDSIEPTGTMVNPPSAIRPPPGTSDEGPVIRVSIGRIDVRAVPPPVTASVTPRPKPAPRTALVSLDDYLRRGTKGGA